ncbi:class I SAM-dependent methyltransferase [Chondrinema litorale]|uniref:class I SAM-dependent methyltransferase n=1 Tax=Chondrinema litorale TaxID=2994555 RepID=UPI0025438522|nr:class I SAM-dependent methyltransferase [Chondrinema litorale]UZR99410.1 class I SAM-dependent methyltransferase [Chondrinema litorale]
MISLSYAPIKEFFELGYWQYIKFFEKKLSNHHYEYFFTEYFSLPKSFYNDKKVLDIGCGPRGSLEWANMTKERIGLDPLVDKYIKMGADKHQMKYEKAYVEKMPFSDNYFDVVSSFNSIDHVENLAKSCSEISRILKPGGIFLLIVDIHSYPTFTEPQMLEWSFIKDYFAKFEILEEKHLEVVHKNRIYENLRTNKVMKKQKSNGVLTAMIKKPVLP